MTQQGELMKTLVESLGLDKPVQKLVEPDIFEGNHQSPHQWLSFYEYASEKIKWISDVEKIKNMRRYLHATARKWYDLQLLDKAAPCWEKWKVSFLAALEISAVKRWDAALGYQYASGSPVEYVLEKRRLLHAAEPRLASTTVLALVMQGLCLDIRNEVQMKAPKTLDELLQCLQNLFPGPELEQEGSVWRRQLVLNNQDVNKLSPHKECLSSNSYAGNYIHSSGQSADNA